MKKRLLVMTLIALCSCGLFEGSSAHQRKQRNISISTSGDDKVITECGQLKIQIGRAEATRSEQVQTIPRSAITELQIRQQDS